MTGRVLRCAIVGAGGIAPEHAKAIARHSRSRLVAVADLALDRAAGLAASWGAAAFDDLDTLLAEAAPDVVILATPPAGHRGQAIAALRAGADVIVEKPPAISLSELDEMLAVAEAERHRLAVVFQSRSGSAAAHIRRLLDSGELGRPLVAVCETLWYRDTDYYAVPWRGTWESEGGGTTLGHGIHQLDLLSHLLGEWQSVEARLWRAGHDIETEDVSTATIRFVGGTVAQVITSAVSPRETSRIRIDTEHATISVEHVYGHDNGNWKITPAPHVAAALADGWRFPAHNERSGHVPFLRGVLDALLDGTPFPPEAEHPARALSLVAAIYASAEADGTPIEHVDLEGAESRGRFTSTVIDLREA